MQAIRQAILAVMLVVVGLAGAIAPGKAEGSAAVDMMVVAQGVGTLPPGKASWQLRVYEANPDGIAPQPQAGFIVAPAGGLLTKVGTSYMSLGAGQASFIPGDDSTMVYAMRAPAAVWQIGLSATSSTTGVGAVKYAGSPFSVLSDDPAPIQLLAARVPNNTLAYVPTGTTPTLVVVAEGTAQLERPGQAPFTMNAGQATVVRGDGQIRGMSARPALVMAARVGEPVLLPTTATPTATPTTVPPTIAPVAATSTLKVTAKSCPVNTPVSMLDVSCTSPGVQIPMVLTGPASARGTTAADGSLNFTNVPAGTYNLAAELPGDFVKSFASCVSTSGAQLASNGQGLNDVTVTVPAGATVACTWYTVPEDARGETGTAGIDLFVTRCPQGYLGVQLTDDCLDPVTDTTFQLDGISPRSGKTDATGALRFVDLASDAYSLMTDAIVPGRGLYVICRDDASQVLSTSVDARTTEINVPADTTVACRGFAMDEALFEYFATMPDDPGSLAVPFLYCANGSPMGELDVDACDEPIADITVKLLRDGAVIPPTRLESTRAVWEGLSDGRYVLVTDGIRVGITGIQLGDERCCNEAGGFDIKVKAAMGPLLLPFYFVPVVPDQDADGLDDEQEIAIGTDPLNPDSDFDGMEDGAELTLTGTDPTNGLSNDFGIAGTRDSDGDGIADLREAELMTNINESDTDGDGVDDYAELENGTDPLAPDV